ncbi:hypothetical protein Lsai_2381 [Legionella sainthelensi]|uniref:Uncharacterized protein n=1 Tax=Legionella sainthelensi TaxID=28087 RepID=A0A0W0YFF2_9GAMM|nr:hypothetical protein Lsai_2381 [Legionella sainthelensi]VEH37464.1 Uncharacterised protein [Legionella sainthelensi]
MEFHTSNLPSTNYSSFVIHLLKDHFPKSKIIVDSLSKIKCVQHAHLIILLKVDNSAIEGSFSIQNGQYIQLSSY